jgi:hypothetical protein
VWWLGLMLLADGWRMGGVRPPCPERRRELTEISLLF